MVGNKSCLLNSTSLLSDILKIQTLITNNIKFTSSCTHIVKSNMGVSPLLLPKIKNKKNQTFIIHITSNYVLIYKLYKFKSLQL